MTIAERGKWHACALAALICTACTVGPDFQRLPRPDVHAYVREPLTGTTAAPAAGGAAQTFTQAAEVPARWWSGF